MKKVKHLSHLSSSFFLFFYLNEGFKNLSLMDYYHYCSLFNFDQNTINAKTNYKSHSLQLSVYTNE